MKDFSRGTFGQWCDKLVVAAQDKCTTFIKDVLVCIRDQQEANIVFDTSLEPTITPILDANGATVDWSKPHPIQMKNWEIEQQNYQRRKEAYDSNKLIICSIIRDSIDPYYQDKLEKHSKYENKRDNPVWLLQTIKSFCSFDTEEEDIALVVINAQLDFLHFRQQRLDLLKYKKLFQQKFSSLKDNKMALGAVEALTTKYSSGSADKKSKQAIEQYAAMVAIRNAGPQYDTLRTELHNNFAKNMSNVYPTTVEDAFELLKKYKTVNHNTNNSRNNNNRTSDTRNSNTSAESNNNDRRNRANNENNRGSTNDHNSSNDNHQLSFAQAVASDPPDNSTDTNEPQSPQSSRTDRS